MIHFLYPTNDFSFNIYNKTETTFSSSDTKDCWSMEWLLTQVEIPYKNITQETSETCYVKFNLNFPTEYTDLDNIPDTTWKKIKNQHNVYLLLYQATEATPFYFWNYRWSILKDFLQCKNIPPQKVKFICGDVDATANHKINVDDYWSFVDVIGIDIFELVHNYRHYLDSKPTDIRKTLKGYLKQKTKKNFLCFNRRPRPNKQSLIFYLKKYNHFDKGLVSNLWEEEDKLISKEEFEIYNFDNSDYNELTPLVPVRNEIQEGNFVANQSSPADLYKKSNFSLVSETFTGSTVRFITEKTYKPIMMGHPFLIHGTTGTLSYLQSLGYETFQNIFDETYDLEKDPKKQLEKIIKNLDCNFKLSALTIEKIKHNQNNFLKLNTRNRIKNQLEEFL